MRRLCKSIGLLLVACGVYGFAEWASAQQPAANQAGEQADIAQHETDMTRVARILWMLSHNGFDHLRNESVMLGERWKQSQIERTVQRIRDIGISIEELPTYGGGFGRVIIRESFEPSVEPPDITLDEPDGSASESAPPVLAHDELLKRVSEIVAASDDETRDRFTEEIASSSAAPPADATAAQSGADVVVIDGRMVAIGRDGAAVLLDEAQQNAYIITIDEGFDGSPAELDLLRLLPTLQQVTISNRTIDQPMLDVLRELPTTHNLTITDCQYDLEQVLSLMRARSDMSITAQGHQAFLGVTLENSAGGDGSVCVVSSVVDGTAADEAGLRVGDEIKSFNGQDVFTFQELIVAIGSRQPGDTVALDVLRDDESLDIAATLKERPPGQ